MDGTICCIRQGKLRAAIAINNNAVSLLAHAYYQEASETFKDALTLMRSIMGARNGAEDSRNLQGLSYEAVQLMLDRARERTASCNQNVAGLQDRPILKVISSQYDPDCISETMAACAPGGSSYIAYPMTVDPVDFEESGSDDIDFFSGAILYNLGIAHLCLAASARLSRDDSAAEFLQAKMYRIFQLTDDLLSGLNVDARAAVGFTLRILLLKAFVTRSLMQASIQLSLPLEFQQYCHSMARLLLLLAAQNCLTAPLIDRVATAA